MCLSYVLELNTKQMFGEGCKFYLSENGVWLTKFVDWNYVDAVIDV